MENQVIIEEDWMGVLIQWLFLFALLALIYFVGWLFGRLARKHEKQGWLYTIIGIALFLTGSYLGAEIDNLIKYVSPPQSFVYTFSTFLRLLFPLIFCWVIYHYLKTNWTKDQQPV